jgi:hypothetical protein
LLFRKVKYWRKVPRKVGRIDNTAQPLMGWAVLNQERMT